MLGRLRHSEPVPNAGPLGGGASGPYGQLDSAAETSVTKTFAAQVADFKGRTLKKMRYVAINAIQDVMEAAQTPQPGVARTGGSFIEGRIPVVSSDLINSLSSNGGGKGALSYTTAIAGMEIGDRLTFAWTSPYAMRIEAGFTGTDSLGRRYNQAGRHFVGKNAERFSDFVAARVREVQ